ncbi:MAG: hypothetical protein R2830_00065 [Saprospiraceae bacterium]
MNKELMLMKGLENILSLLYIPFSINYQKQLGVLHVLSDTRKEEIKSKLGERTDLIISFFNDQGIKLLANDYKTNKTILGKSNSLDIATKEVGD